jgi:hypothetical protein
MGGVEAVRDEGEGMYYEGPGCFCVSEAEEGREGVRSGIKGVIVKPKVSSCWKLVPVNELWWVYGDVRVPGRGDHGRCAVRMGMSKWTQRCRGYGRDRGE